MELEFWCAFKAVMEGLLDSKNDEPCESLADTFAKFYKEMGFRHH